MMPVSGAPSPDRALRVRRRGLVDYADAWQAMRAFNAARGPHTPDEIWLLQHPPVYTLGLSCRDDPRTEIAGVPVVHSDRGGRITYHGPGQLLAYVLIDLRRRGQGPRWLVDILERSVIDLLAGWGITGTGRAGAPGVYIEGRKVASLGLRVRRGASYHGLSLNVDMDLAPFRRIDPCGYRGLEVTQLADLGVAADLKRVGDGLLGHLRRALAYTTENAVRPCH